MFKMWKEAEMNLTKKREVRAKLELQRKLDKIPVVSAEITDVSSFRIQIKYFLKKHPYHY